jgi:hypothetical protein
MFSPPSWKKGGRVICERSMALKNDFGATNGVWGRMKPTARKNGLSFQVSMVLMARSAIAKSVKSLSGCSDGPKGLL